MKSVHCRICRINEVMEMKNDAFITELKKSFGKTARKFVKNIWKKRRDW